MPSPLDIDAVFVEIGEMGPQQIKYVLGIGLLNAYGAWHMLQHTFVGYDVPFRCEPSDEDALHYDECPGNQRLRCSKLYFVGTEEESTIVSEWDLVCDRSWLTPLPMSSFMFGVMLGALVLGSLSDRIGRRKSTTLFLAAILFLNGMSAVAPMFSIYLAIKFATGFFTGGYIISIFVLGNELVGASWRGIVGNVIQGFFAGGIILYTGSAYFCRQWRSLTLLTTLVGAPLLLLHFYLPESPRWLQSKGRSKEAIAVLKKIALLNGRKLSYENCDEEAGDCSKGTRKIESGDRVTDLFRQPVLLTAMLIQIFSWFVNSVVYYGLTIAASHSKAGGAGDKYSQTAISGLVEFPAYFLAATSLSFWGRKRTLGGCMITGGVVLLSMAVLSSYQGLVNAAAYFGKFCIAASFSVVYIHSAEIFPTSVRNSAMGIVGSAARLGGILAPLMARNLGKVYPNLHFLLFGLLSLFAGILNMRLPDTTGLPLPECISDMKRLITSNATSSSPKKDKSSGYKRLATSEAEKDYEDGEEEMDENGGGGGFEVIPSKSVEKLEMA